VAVALVNLENPPGILRVNASVCCPEGFEDCLDRYFKKECKFKEKKVFSDVFLNGMIKYWE